MPENFGVAPQMLGANLDMPEKFGPMLCSWVDDGTRAAGSVVPDTSRQAGLGMVGATGLEPTPALAFVLIRARSGPVASALGVTLGVRDDPASGGGLKTKSLPWPPSNAGLR